MTQEQKARAYDKVSKEVKDFFEGKQKMYSDVNQTLEYLFPELKESANEKIRNDIKRAISVALDYSYFDNETANNCLAWLKKQDDKEEPQVYKTKDREVITYSETDGYKIVEPKFKVGDWITDGNITIQIETIKNNCYLYCGDCTLYSTKTADKVYHLWTIADAKDGDVLLFEGYYNSIVLFQGIGINGEGHINYYCKCDLDNYSFGIQGDVAYLGTIEKNAEQFHPVTKEQRNLLFQKIKEAGYEWDAKKKKLKKVEQESENYKQQVMSEMTDLVKDYISQKPVWSEEDERMLVDCFNILHRSDYPINKVTKTINWLKSIKERIGG